MTSESRNVRTLDWQDFEPQEVADAGSSQGARRSWLRGWMLMVLYGIAFASIYFAYQFSRSSFEAKFASQELGRFGRDLIALEKKTIGKEDYQSGHQEFINVVNNSEVGFQMVEKSVRDASSQIALDIGNLWDDIRRDALVDKIDLEKIRSTKQQVEAGRRELGTVSTNLLQRASLTKGISAFLMLLCLIFSLASLKKQGTTLVVQSVVSALQAQTQEQQVHSAKGIKGLQAIDRLPTPLARISAEGMIESWNESIQDLTSLNAADTLGRPFLDALGWKSMGDVAKSTFYKVFQGETVYDVEWKYNHKSGQIVDLRAKFIPIKDDFGGVAGAYVALQDVTTERRQRQMLTDSDATKTAILQALPDTLMRIKFSGEMLEVHDNYNLFLEPTSLIGSDWLKMLPSEFVSEILRMQKETLQSRVTASGRYIGYLEGRDVDLILNTVPCGLTDILVILAPGQCHNEGKTGPCGNSIILMSMPDQAKTLTYTEAILTYVSQEGGTASLVYFGLDKSKLEVLDEADTSCDCPLKRLGAEIKAASQEDEIVGRIGPTSFLWILPEQSKESALSRAQVIQSAVGPVAAMSILSPEPGTELSVAEAITQLEESLFDGQAQAAINSIA